MLNKILVPSDLSTESNSILPYALTLGQAFQSKVYLLHVVDRLDPRKAALVPAFPHIRSFLKRDRQAAGGRTLPAEIPVGRVHLYQDDPESSILDYAARQIRSTFFLAA